MAEQRGWIYGYGDLGIPAILLDGSTFEIEIPIPEIAPKRTLLTYISWCHHMGQVPRESLGGLLYILVAHRDGTRTPLMATGNWEGACDATFDPPVVVRESDKIILSLGGQTRPQWAWDPGKQDWVSREVFASVGPDTSMRWLVTDPSDG